MKNEPLFRCQYRACLALPEDDALPLPCRQALAACEQNARTLIGQGRLLTAALYHYRRQLFLYYEAVGGPREPEAFMGPLHPHLVPWPQKETIRDWAPMYPIYWHDVPRDAADWQRPAPPQKRRGRIAYLRPETMFEYCYHHFAIVQEGLFPGDRYQFISLHEDVLFSYFEEPKSFTNIRHEPETGSQAIEAWLAADPAAHFIPLPGSEGENFLLLPAYFALGQENGEES